MLQLNHIHALSANVLFCDNGGEALENPEGSLAKIHNNLINICWSLEPLHIVKFPVLNTTL